MLTSISVQGFKSLQDVRDLELGQVNVFVGANGSGKTNLLEAVGLLGASVGGDYLDDQILSRRGVRLGALLYQSAFKSVETFEKIVVCVTWGWEQGAAGYEIELENITDAQNPPWPCEVRYKLNDQVASGKAKLDFPYSHQRSLYTLSNYAIFAPNTLSLRGLEPDPTQRSPLGLRGGGLAKAVADLLNIKQGTFGALDLDELLQLLDWVDDIAIEASSHESVPPYVPMTRDIIVFTDRWMKEERNQLSAYDASEGALYVLFALALALHPDAPRLFAIENLDQAMHPRLARATIRLFCQQVLQSSPQRQVLLTTHNPLVLDGLDLRDDRIRLFTVERNRHGATRVDRVQVSDEIVQKVEDGLTLSELWVMGLLGGTPDIF